MDRPPVRARWAALVEMTLLTLAALIFASGAAVVIGALMDGFVIVAPAEGAH